MGRDVQAKAGLAACQGQDAPGIAWTERLTYRRLSSESLAQALGGDPEGITANVVEQSTAGQVVDASAADTQLLSGFAGGEVGVRRYGRRSRGL
jgi:hypothetical protein